MSLLCRDPLEGEGIPNSIDFIKELTNMLVLFVYSNKTVKENSY